jgi:hypothetical protein
MELPIAPSCDLDADGLRSQRERYRQVGDGAVLVERTARLVAVQVPAESAQVVPELVEIESRCCPFFDLTWDPDGRRFSVSVSDQQHEPALDAICFALGVQVPSSRITKA